MSKEHQIIKRLSKEKQKPPKEIVAIHFAVKRFEVYQCLIEIDRLANAGEKVRVRQAGDKPKNGHKYEKEIAKIKVQIAE